ncbi:MAG: class I SAM-dependent methyltransferase [Proteobacteria bacterium]|nr:class I SAM-dependent methyltransferase [Pseudomonadota bacterium]
MKPHCLNEREEELDIFFGVINRFIGYFTRDAIRASQNNTSHEYPFVPMDTRQAYAQISLARDLLRREKRMQSGVSFIDVGCGIGNVLLMAELMDFTVYGIEKDEYPFKIAQKLMGDECVAQDDIWEFSRFGDFDVVYYFRPFAEKELQLTFEHMIEDKLKPGSILIANRKMDMAIDTDPRFRRLEEQWPVWQKLKAEKDNA